jgi:hypothetical protein
VMLCFVIDQICLQVTDSPTGWDSRSECQKSQRSA